MTLSEQQEMYTEERMILFIPAVLLLVIGWLIKYRKVT